MDLQFTLKNQVINRIDRNTVVSGSRNYLYAKFTFLSEDWHAPVTVIFGKYSVLLDSENKCLVPWEVLENPGSFDVSAFCGDLQTANTVRVFVAKSGYIQGETPSEPTPDVYTQLAGMVQDAIERAEEATETATGAATSAGEFADNAEKSAQAAAQSELSAAEAATAAGNMAADAAASAQAAHQSAEQAAQVVVGAGQIVKDAETAALAAINEAESAAVLTVNQAGQIQTNAVNQAGTSALSSISTAKTDALNGIDSTKNDAVDTIIESRNEAVQGAETAIADIKNQAVSNVQSVGQSAVGAVEEAQTQATEAVDTAGNQALQDISDAKTSATSAVNTAGENAVNSVNSAGQATIENAQTAITAAKNQAVSGVESAGQSATENVQNAQTTAVEAVETAQTTAVQAVQDAGTAEVEKINDILPVPTEADAGKVPVAKPDGTGYELGTVEGGGAIDDENISAETTWSSQNIVQKLCPPFEVSGSVVTCNPVEGSQLNTVVQIAPVQVGTGDPSTENVRPIKGFDTVNVWRGGKNLYNGLESVEFIKSHILTNVILYPGTYTFSANIASTDTNSTSCYVIMQNGNTSIKEFSIGRGDFSYKTFTLDKIVNRIILYASTGAANSEGDTASFSNIQIELGSVATDYEPYRGETFTVALGQTVYGGTLDLTSGVLTVTHTLGVLDGLELPVYVGTLFNGYWASYNGPYANGKLPICNIAKGVILNQTTGYTLRADYNQFRFQGFAEYYPTVNDFKAFLQTQNAQIVVELASPIVIQLSPQEILALSGENTVYADAGDVTVSGYSDPTTIIKNLADRIAALEQNAIGG